MERGHVAAPARQDWRKLRIAIVVTLIVITAQGWTGDTANLFVTTAPAAATSSLSGALQTISAAGLILEWHASEGLLILGLSLVVLAMSLRSKPRSIRAAAILATFMVISAGIGGLMFVLSGFQSAPASAQMGGSFIGAYAFYFIELYYTK